MQGTNLQYDWQEEISLIKRLIFLYCKNVMILNENICDSATFWITVYIYIVSCTGTQKHFCSKGKGKYKKQKKKHKVTDISKYLQLQQHQVSTPHSTEQSYMQQRNILPTSLSIQSLSGGKNNSSTIMSCSKNNSVGSVATVSSQRIAHHQSPYNNTNSYGANSNATSAAKVSNSISVQVLPTSPSTGHGNSNGSSSHRNDVRSSVGVSTASALLTTSPSSVAAHQSQQQQRLQQQTPPSQQYSNKVRQKSPAQLVSPVQQHTASNLAAALTPENVTQMLATMQPQTPSSSQVGQYFKQTSPTCQQPKPTQSSPLQQSPPPLYGSLKNSSTSIPTSVARSMQQQPPSQINMTANNQQFMVGQQQSQQQQPQQPSPQNLSKPGGNLASASNYFPVSEIRLPTVPIPTTSMFSSITPVISQAAAASSNYLFTNLPQHSAQPNFDVSMLQSKTIGAGNRTPVSNSNDLFSNLLNMPKWSSVGRIQRAMLNEYSKWYVYYVLVQEQCNTDTVPPTEFVMNTFISILFLTIQLLGASKFESEWGHHNE